MVHKENIHKGFLIIGSGLASVILIKMLGLAGVIFPPSIHLCITALFSALICSIAQYKLMPEIKSRPMLVIILVACAFAAVVFAWLLEQSLGMNDFGLVIVIGTFSASHLTYHLTNKFCIE